MQIEKFWNLIEEMQVEDYSLDAHYEQCLNVLRKLSNEELVGVEVNLYALKNKAYNWDLWGAAFLINSGCSDDNFIDFRVGLIYQGKSIFESALSDPDSLVSLGNAEDLIEYEKFGYAPYYAFEEKNDGKADIHALSDLEIGKLPRVPEPTGEAWDDEAELQERLPKLFQKYSSD